MIDGDGHALNRMIIHFPDGRTIEPIPAMDVPVKSLTGFNPQKVLLGISGKPYPGGLIAVDAIWQQWSRWINYFYQRPDPPLRDTWTVRVGLEHTFYPPWAWLPSFSLRAGWYYQPTPVPSQNGQFNLLDCSKNVYAAGFGFSIGRVLGIIRTPVKFDFGMQVHDLVPRSISNDHDENFPRMAIGGRVYQGAAAVEINF